MKQLADEGKLRSMIPESCYYSKLDLLGRQEEYLVLMAGETEIMAGLKAKGIEFKVYNAELDATLSAEVVALKGSLVSCLVHRGKAYTLEEARSNGLLE